MGIFLGAMTPPLHVQLAAGKEACKPYQSDADAATRLHVRGVMTDAEVNRIRRRILKELMADQYVRASMPSGRPGEA